jgi:hypothetical protein
VVTFRDKWSEVEATHDAIAILGFLQASIRELLQEHKQTSIRIDDRQVNMKSVLKVESDLQSMVQAQQLKLEQLMSLKVLDDALNMEDV